MLTAAAVQGFRLFAGYLSAAADRTGSLLEALYANGRLYLEFSDRYPGHFKIMFRPALINTAAPGYKSADVKQAGRVAEMYAD